MTYGFVYILINDCMPDVYKIGCTERSPHQRADELSKPTGVPTPFRVLCYAEFGNDDFGNFQAVERALHAWMNDRRVNESREFFKGEIASAVAFLHFHPRSLSFSMPGWRIDTTGWHAGSEMTGEVKNLVLSELENPWRGTHWTAQEPEKPRIGSMNEWLTRIANEAGI